MSTRSWNDADSRQVADAVAFLEPPQAVRELDQLDSPAVDSGTFGIVVDDEPKMTSLCRSRPA
jgi:hypothetical protein